MLSAPDETKPVAGTPDKPRVKITGSKDSLNNYIWDQTHGIVQSGPFKGMQLLKEKSWQDDNLGTCCLGCYEQELHDIVEGEIKRLSALDNPKIVNIGCAEGYYAVGLAMRIPQASVFVVDNDEAVALCEKAAALNGAKVIKDAMLDEIINSADLIVSDCEGAEIVYLDTGQFPGLVNATIIVETHDFPEQHTSQIMLDRFNKTHKLLWCLSEMVRTPNNFEALVGLPSHAKWMAVSEGRPSTQYYFYMRPNALV